MDGRDRKQMLAQMSLVVSGVGAIVALTLWLTQPIAGIGLGLGLGAVALGLLGWVSFAPEQVRALLTGRWLRFGGVAMLVLVVFGTMLVSVYALIRAQGWRVDLSATDFYSLTDDNRHLIQTLTRDPSMPDVHLLAFLGVAQAGLRDRLQGLLDEYVSTSDGRITYEFIDPDRDPVRTNQYQATAGQAILLPRLADGELNQAQARRMDSINQQSISNALVNLSARGDYRAYFLAFEDTLDISDPSAIGASLLASQLRNSFNWRVEMVSLFDLDAGTLRDGTPLNDPVADGEVLVIAGGSSPLNNAQFAPLQAYIEAGGSLVIFAGVNVGGGQSLATADNLNALLMRDFGIRFNNDLVVDPSNAVQSLFVIRANRWGQADFVATYTPNDHADFIASRSIRADDVREDVLITPIIYTSDTGYAKSDFDFSANFTEIDLAVQAGDALGVQLLGALSHHLARGNRLALFGSESLVFNEYEAAQRSNTRNIALARDAIFWTVNYDSVLRALAVQQVGISRQEAPLNATLQQLNGIQFASVFAIPFGVLLLGFMVWWRYRD